MRSLATVLFLIVATSARADDWRTEDTYREAAYLTLHAIDWGQTRTIARHPERYTEKNRILGEHPSVGRVDRYFALTAIGHVGLAYALPHNGRTWFQRSTITLELFVVGRNYHLGIAIDL